MEVHYGVNGEYKTQMYNVMYYGHFFLLYGLNFKKTNGTMILTFDQSFQNAGEAHSMVHTSRRSTFKSKGFNHFMTDHKLI